LEPFAMPSSLCADRYNEQPGMLQAFARIEAAPPMEQGVAFAQPLPFTLLRRYRLVNPNASVIRTEAQSNHILAPVVNALYQQWGVRVTRNRLQALLDYLMQDFEIDITIAESNLRWLMACSEFTEPCL
jgi:hypothetical protein